jgi:hypothetical protein
MGDEALAEKQAGIAKPKVTLRLRLDFYAVRQLQRLVVLFITNKRFPSNRSAARNLETNGPSPSVLVWYEH